MQSTRGVIADYASLKQAVSEAGCFKRSPWRSIFSFVCNVACSVALFIASADSDGVLSVLLFAAGSIFYYRLGWLMHDGAHGAVFDSPRKNQIFADIVAAFIGEFPSGWRHVHHKKHHAAPNVRGIDIDHAQRWDKEQVSKNYFTAVLGVLFFNKIGRFYFPKSVLTLTLRDGYFCYRYARENFSRELLLGFLGYSLQIGFLVFLFGAWGLPLFLAHTFFGMVYVNTVFVGSHYDCDSFDIEEFEALDFAEVQIRSSRNYEATGFLSKFMFGGIESQIEHHLFPSMPRHRFQKASTYVKSFCEARGLPYRCLPFWKCIGQALRFQIEGGKN